MPRPSHNSQDTWSCDDLMALFPSPSDLPPNYLGSDAVVSTASSLTRGQTLPSGLSSPALLTATSVSSTPFRFPLLLVPPSSFSFAGIIFKVDHSEWATPIVVVPKADKSVWLCGDYKVTVNPCIEVPQHPLSCAEDIFATLAGGTVFTKLDLSHAYQQLQLDEHAQELLTINTHRVLYRFTRLPFGVSSAPAIFQAVLEHILRGLKRVSCRLDDILVNEKSVSEHLINPFKYKSRGF